ncbi:cytochrome P450 4C1-like [Chrysoperla carnea]|uniref:cytochrome P450 4C1-like n=1 Tax=Chrysoperla carnea TaxID=189513 RepID=UPI001D07A7C4|nr:cytochrome P450 4C1-like [Chrysoperla carnea]
MILVYALITFYIFWKYIKFYKLQKIFVNIPSPKGYPIIGNYLDFINSSDSEIFKLTCDRCSTYYPRLWAVWIWMKPALILHKAEHIEAILKGVIPTKKSRVYKYVEPWLGQSLLTSAGMHWKTHRKLLTPAFHFTILKEFQSVISEKADILVDRLKTAMENNQEIELLPYINQCTLDVICETSMGVSINAQSDSPPVYYEAITNFTELAIKRQFSMFGKYEFLWNLTSQGRRQSECLKILHDFADAVIQERKHKLQQNITDENNNEEDNRKLKPFLDIMLESDEPLTDKEIRDEVSTFLFAGHDTSSTNINWTLFLLGNYPHIQDRVYEELNSIFNGSKRHATNDDLIEMKYLEMCIKESLRMYPSAPRISRVITEDTNIDGYFIPKNTSVCIHIYKVHHDPEHFSQPETFNPDNFLPENIAKRHPFSYIPFSAGARNCIGQKFAIQEIKLILSSILRSFKVISLSNQHDVQIQSAFILTSKEGLKFRLVPRL